MRIAEYLAALGQLDRARALMESALALAPGDARLMFQAGVLHEQRFKDRDKALEWLGRALRGRLSIGGKWNVHPRWRRCGRMIVSHSFVGVPKPRRAEERAHDRRRDLH